MNTMDTGDWVLVVIVWAVIIALGRLMIAYEKERKGRL